MFQDTFIDILVAFKLFFLTWAERQSNSHFPCGLLMAILPEVSSRSCFSLNWKKVE